MTISAGPPMVARPGFERLVAWLCAGEVGAVLCFDASRLSRNGRDWHHLLELCGLVQARVIDAEGVYDPCRPNDRLLLGMNRPDSQSTYSLTFLCLLLSRNAVGEDPGFRRPGATPSRRQI